MARFPRNDDGLGWAWGLQGDRPAAIWERLSPAYEAQAQALLAALAPRFSLVMLDWAGSQDGEAAIGLNAGGALEFCYHLENPQAAQALQAALEAGRIDAFLDEWIAAEAADQQAARDEDGDHRP
ncbi:MAG: hypothetical protein Q4G26_15680 [Paracoccus sp. (in: a-proteobacteria)]|nr:hypothetical protein [Paracoccus sp. (in: a-proteobacteria)]